MTVDHEPGVRWAQVLHFYQPPLQTHEILARVVEESYRPLHDVLLGFRGARVANHMNAVLAEALHDHGYEDVLASLRLLGERGQAEFLGGARFHPILPLLTPAERRRAIAENDAANRRLLGGGWAPKGFFPPELALTPSILPEISAAGHSWVLASGIAAPDQWPVDHVPVAKAGSRPVSVLFRDDARSNRISFRQLTAADWVRELSALAPSDGRSYVVTAMDAETFGHHIAGWEREFLAACYGLLADPGRVHVRMVQPSEVVAQFPAGPLVEPRSSSWSTSNEDIAAGNPLPLWNAPGNRIHRLQWEYVALVREMLARAEQAVSNPESQRYAKLAGEVYQPALHSCQFWWASHRPWWEPFMIQRGLGLLTQALLFAAHAAQLGQIDDETRREIRWSLAAANDTREQLERLLFSGNQP